MIYSDDRQFGNIFSMRHELVSLDKNIIFYRQWKQKNTFKKVLVHQKRISKTEFSEKEKNLTCDFSFSHLLLRDF